MQHTNNKDMNSNGAHFLKADLHIHSYKDNGSYDVDDPLMNPQNIVETAITRYFSDNHPGISAITTHLS